MGFYVLWWNTDSVDKTFYCKPLRIYHMGEIDWGEGSVFMWISVKFASVLGNPKSSKCN